MISRPIPSTGELLPVIGIGSWDQFDAGISENDRKPLKLMTAYGAKVIDTSPMYENAEEEVR